VKPEGWLRGENHHTVAIESFYTSTENLLGHINFVLWERFLRFWSQNHIWQVTDITGTEKASFIPV